LNLGGRFLRGSLTLSAGSWAGQAVNLGIQILIARLLGPSEFGLYAFCFAVSEFLTIVGAFSLQHALVQAREASQEDFDTAFAICAALGLVGIVLAGVIAPVLWVHKGPEAAWILLMMSVASLGRFLAQPPQAELERSLRYGAVAFTMTTAAVVPNLVALGLAWAGFGVWSLAWRDVLVGTSWAVLSLAVSGYRFRGRLSRDAWQRLMDFSKPLFVSRTLEIALERLDAVAVGALLGNRAAGLYHWSRSLTEIGSMATRPLERVSLNLFSRLQDDPRRMARAYELVQSFLLRALLLGSVVLLVYPQQVVRLVLGEEWLDVAPLLRWLAVYGAVMPLLNNVKVLFYGRGEVRAMVRIRAAQTLVFAAGVLLACWQESLEGVAAALLLSNVFALGLAWRGSRGLVDFAPERIAAAPVLAAIGTVAASEGLIWLGLEQRLPWFVLPLVPAALYVCTLVLLEGRRLAADLGFLSDQMRGARG
jgi:O-antigen/teichoic acid export membrane protein